MTIAPEEVASFVAHADSLLINIGTLSSERRQSIEIAVDEAIDQGLPWALDPAFVDRARLRAAFARTLIRKYPRAVRLNRAEFAILAGAETADDPARLRSYAQEHQAVIGLTGETDLVLDETRLATLSNGHVLMSRVTAIGCAASAVIAAFLAVEPDAWRATAAALLAFGIAGEIAGERARGPGSFGPELLDAFYNLDREAILARAKIS
jgi:hydroxyethylthiazole kinase